MVPGKCPSCGQFALPCDRSKGCGNCGYGRARAQDVEPDPTTTMILPRVRAGLYWWVRDEDETGMSGKGRVAQVAVFEDGSAVLRWLKARNSAGVQSTVFYESIRDLLWVHGHGEAKTGHLEVVAV